MSQYLVGTNSILLKNAPKHLTIISTTLSQVPTIWSGYVDLILLSEGYINSKILYFMLTQFIQISGTYYAAIIENRVDFNGRIVVDVGAGSGILSLFAAQVPKPGLLLI